MAIAILFDLRQINFCNVILLILFDVQFLIINQHQPAIVKL